MPDDLRIEQIPIVPVADPHADAPPRLQEPLRRKDLDGFANGRAADAELDGQIVLAGQQVVGSISPAKNPSPDGVNDRAMDLALVSPGRVARYEALPRALSLGARD